MLCKECLIVSTQDPLSGLPDEQSKSRFPALKSTLGFLSKVFCTEQYNLRDEKVYHPYARGTFEPVTPFKPSFSALKKSASDGCRLCDFARQVLENQTDSGQSRSEEELDEHPVSFSWWTLGYMECGGTFQVYSKNDEYHVIKSIDVAISTDLETHNKWSVHRNIEIDPVSDKAVRLMKLWLQNCFNNHPECTEEECETSSMCGSSPTPVLPTRVIDVGSENSPPRLVISGGETAHYAALSHCWGKCSRTTTTKDSIQQMMHGIPLSEFSPTFRDAIIVCRRLEIPYLWIDSLCIIQDDNEDWTRESSNMTSIYAHSYITLAAAQSTSSQQSFLRRRPAVLAGYELNASLGLFIRPWTESWILNLVFTKYNSRAWCFQEQQLPARVLYFTEQELMWNCKHGRQEEGIVESVDTRNEHITRLFDRWQIQPDVKMSVEATSWYDIIEEYTRKEMTFPEDRLPALSGMAAQVQRATGSQYLAGLWRDSLIQGLLWRGSKDSIFLTRATVDAGPTWSWASYHGGVFYARDPLILGKDQGDDEKKKPEEEEEEERLPSKPRDLVTILDAHATLRDEIYPHGRVTSGQLTLRGPCQNFTYSQLSPIGKEDQSSRTVSPFLPSSRDEDPTLLFDLDPSLPASAIQPIDELTYLVCRVSPITVTRQPKRWERRFRRNLYGTRTCYVVYGLILRAVEGREGGVYERVGVGDTMVDADTFGRSIGTLEQRTVQII